MLKKKIWKRITACCLSMLVLLGSVIPAQAANTEERGDLEETILLIKEMYPDAVVEVKDGVINVTASLPNVIQTRATSEYAPDGGSYRGFVKPWYVSTDSALPYSMVYLGHEQTVALQLARSDSSLVSTVITWVAGDLSASALEKVAAKIAAKYGVWLTRAGILLIVAVGTYEAISWIDQVMFNTAMHNCTLAQQKISITRTTTNGWPTNMYFAWNSNYVSCSPYESYNPTFYKGTNDL